VRLAWHLGPDVDVVLDGTVAELSWSAGRGRLRTARLHLPEQLAWTAHRGETTPVLGWYSPGFGQRVPSWTLVGAGAWTGLLVLNSVLDLSHTAPAGVGGIVTDVLQAGPAPHHSASAPGGTSE
jgi:hypothetical protein